MKTLSKNKNRITDGILWKSFIFYFLPLLMSLLIQQSYSIVDALIIGNFAGKVALAAVDAPLAYIKLLINTFIAFSSGGSIIISQFYGKKDWQKIRKNISVLLNLSFFGGIFLTVLGFFLAPKFLDIMLVPKDIYKLSLVYLRVYFLGTIFVFLFNNISGILRAMGDSKSSFIYLTISSILNIFLDILFVAYFKLGTMGAALATIISQLIAAVLIFYKLKIYKDFYYFQIFKFKEDLKYLKYICILGLPIAMQAVIFSIANMFMQRGINSFGTIGIAAWSICGKTDFLIWNISETLGISVTTFVAQNFGASKVNRAKKTVYYSFWIGSLLLIVVSFLLYYFIEYLAILFTRDIETVKMTIFVMRIIAPFYIFYMYSEIYAGAIRGMGNTFYPMLMNLIAVCVFRLFWIFFILPKDNVLETVIKGYPFSWFLAALLQMLCYQYFRKTKK